MKKIVVITGSPRREGNSFAMTKAFIERAEARGHQVTRFDAAFRKVGGCHACETCFRTGKACSFDDDFNQLAPVILEADAVRIPLERSAALLKWSVVGEVLVPGVLKVGDIEKTDGCRQSEALADKF